MVKTMRVTSFNSGVRGCEPHYKNGNIWVTNRGCGGSDIGDINRGCGGSDIGVINRGCGAVILGLLIGGVGQ